MLKLIDFFINRSLLVNLISIMLLLAGAFSIYSLRKEMFPEVDFDIILVTATYQGSTPEDVEKLVLSRQRIGVLPENIARLANLKELRLFKSNLHELPATIGGLDKLEELVLSDNKLKELPPEIGKLKNLKRLSLHHNQLTHLPKEIGNLENLEVLNLGFNKLDSIPQEIIQLKKLKFPYSQTIIALTTCQHYPVWTIVW